MSTTWHTVEEAAKALGWNDADIAAEAAARAELAPDADIGDLEAQWVRHRVTVAVDQLVAGGDPEDSGRLQTLLEESIRRRRDPDEKAALSAALRSLADGLDRLSTP